MTTLRKIAMLCLIAVLILAIVTPLFSMNAADSRAMRTGGQASHALFDELPTPTPTPGAGTNSNPSGGDGGG